MKRIKLFCFPFAGGSASSYNKWRHYLDRQVDLRSIELAGRGKRIYEPLYNNMAEAVNDVYEMIGPELSHGSYAFFGHSMGAIIVYELARKIKINGLPQPQHLFFSGRGAPNVPAGEDEEIYYHLPDAEFKEKIIELGGTPKEFFEHPELLEVLMPMLRSDFKVAETYEHQGEVEPFDHDITILLGKDEEVKAHEMHEWRSLTKKICTVHFFPGDHFFIFDHTEQVVNIVNQNLLRLLG